jgi:hypothetical protein
MPRNLVDARRDNVCSQGLHFCSKDYLDSYGTSNRDADRCMLVKINPADVVSIPSDYNNAKGRVWTYEVVGEMADAQWREILGKKDYTEASVVSSVGEEYVPDTAPRLNQTPTKEGLKWITNGEKNTRIPKGDKIPDGWRYGASYLVISKKDKRKTISVSTPIPKGWKIVKARK